MVVHDAVANAPDLPDLAIEELVTRTQLSEVWRGRRTTDGAEVAVKLATCPEAGEALRVEADTVRALEEGAVQGIVPVEYRDRPVPHLVMPWKGRRTFRDVLLGIRTGGDRWRAMRLLLSIVDTVAEVHLERFLHGDLKPENVLVDDDGRPWLADFGMARAIRSKRLDSSISRSMSRSEEGWGGTLLYLPPEGVQGEPPTPAWDVYALGVMLHEVLLGSRPDRAATPESLKAILPEEVVNVLLAALAYERKDRIPTAPKLRSMLAGVRLELTATGPVRWALTVRRLCVNGLAAFFVALRYVSVLVLLCTYVWLAVATVYVDHLFLFGFIAVVGLHMVIRWEGPESAQEAALRRAGGVVAREHAT